MEKILRGTTTPPQTSGPNLGRVLDADGYLVGPAETAGDASVVRPDDDTQNSGTAKKAADSAVSTQAAPAA